jgi:tetratricopeptide (TPR) repeat protein
VQACREAAEGYYQRVEATSPGSYRLYQIQAERPAWEGKVTETSIEYREALTRKPDIEGVHRAIADLYWAGGLFGEAEKEYEEELRWNPLDSESRLQLALYSFGRGYPERARQNLEVPSRVKQHSSHAYPRIGQARLGLGDFAKGESPLDRAILGDPADPFTYQLLGKVYQRMGRVDTPQRGRESFPGSSPKAGNLSTEEITKPQR